MVKEALGYVLIGLWVSYVNSNSGNPRLDLYRKANLLSQMMNIFAESVGALPKGASKIQYIIRIIREHRAWERSVEEINYLLKKPARTTIKLFSTKSSNHNSHFTNRNITVIVCECGINYIIDWKERKVVQKKVVKNDN